MPWPVIDRGDLPEEVPAYSDKSLWWRAECGHTWQESVFMRTLRVDDMCPFCANRQVLRGFNDLRTTHPKLAKEWDRERNGGLRPTEVAANSCRKVWWKCAKGHSWKVAVVNRTRDPDHDPGCPYCRNRKCWPGYNDLVTTHPKVASEWHPHSKLKPTEVMAGSRKTVWWAPPCGHRFQLPVRQKVAAKPGYCPICTGRLVPERKVDLREYRDGDGNNRNEG